MEEILKKINFNLNNLIRFIYPGVFIFVRIYNMNIQNYLTILIFCASVFFVYPIYKSTYWLAIRSIQSLFNWIPQLSWHREQVESFSFSNPNEKKYYSSFSICSTCINTCIHMISKKRGKKMLREVEFQNTLVHVLYMTSFISICILFLYIVKAVDASFFLKQSYKVEIALAIVGLVAGSIYDRYIADLRELSLLKTYKKDYIKILRNLIEK